MYKVFLVEDEYIMREGIKNNIDWTAHGYEFCGEAGDGELAFPMIQKLKPDIVISDVKMPFVDGLELSRLIKKDMPWIEIILLSGYEEFEYAKEGIKIGIARYLTKPISGDDLIKEIDMVAEQIEEKRKEREVLEKYNREMEENQIQERKKLFQYLVTGNMSVPELLDMSEKLQIDISAIWYNIVLVHIQPTNKDASEFSSRMVYVEEKLKQFEIENDVIFFDRNLDGKAILVKADTKEDLEIKKDKIIENVKRIVSPYAHIRYFGGIGKPVNRMRELSDSFEAASHAMAHRYLVSDSIFLNGENLKSQKSVDVDGFDISKVSYDNIDRNKFREFLKCGELDDVSYFVDEYFEAMDSNAFRSKMFRQYITMDIYFCVSEFLNSMQIPKEEIDELTITIEVMESEEMALNYIKHVITKAIEHRQTIASDKYGDIVQQVIKYIEENYADEDLSLNVLAEQVNFSPSYLSMIFSQQTGQTIIKQLTDVRMQKAKELLRCTGKRSGEISMEVGYKDPHYFSYLFKKTQGMTPSKYRGSVNQGDNIE